MKPVRRGASIVFTLSLLGLARTPSARAEESTSPVRLVRPRNMVRLGGASVSADTDAARDAHVDTSADSGVDVRFRDTSALRVGDGTSVVLFDPTCTGYSRRASAQATLRRGVVNASRGLEGASPEGNGLWVTSEAGDVSLTRGAVRVDVDATHRTRLAVYEGQARLGTTKSSLLVPAGFGSVLRIGRDPTPLVRLPAPPVWEQPMPAAKLATSGAGGRYGTALGMTAMIASWHLQVSSDPGFLTLLKDARLPSDEQTYAATPKAPGRYFARVSAVDTQGFEGPFGTTATFVVATVDVQDLGRHQTSISLAPAGLSCVVDDGALLAMTAPLVVDRARPHHVRCGAQASDLTLVDLTFASEALGKMAVDVRWLSQDGANHRGEVAVFVREGLGDPVVRDDVTVTTAVPGVSARLVGPGHEYGSYRVELDWAPNATTFSLAVRVAGTPEVTSQTLFLPRPLPAPKK